MGDLAQYRREIDAIDLELIVLFERRMEVVKQVAEYKEKQGMAIYQQDRETQVIARIRGLLKDPSYADGAEEWFIKLMEISKRYQSARFIGGKPE